jgi:hypothetical protein
MSPKAAAAALSISGDEALARRALEIVSPLLAPPA